MIGNKTSEALYTVIKNNTDRRILLTSYGNMKNGNIAPGSYIVHPGYLLEGVPAMRMTNVYNTIRNGTLSVFLVVRTADGYQTVQLGDTGDARFTDADADALFMSEGAKLEAKKVAERSTARAATRQVRSEDGFTITASGKSNKMAAALGARIADEQPVQHAPLNTDLTATHGAAKIAAGNTDAIKAAAKAQNAPAPVEPESTDEPAAAEDDSKMSREELALVIDECYAAKDWNRLMRLLAAEWPAVEFSKPSIMRLKSLDGIMSKYELL